MSRKANLSSFRASRIYESNNILVVYIFHGHTLSKLVAAGRLVYFHTNATTGFGSFDLASKVKPSTVKRQTRYTD